MSGRGREALPDVREWSGDLKDVREWSGGPPVYSIVVGSSLPEVRECSGGPPECSGVVGRPSRMSGSGQEALPDVR